MKEDGWILRYQEKKTKVWEVFYILTNDVLNIDSRYNCNLFIISHNIRQSFEVYSNYILYFTMTYMYNATLKWHYAQLRINGI